MSASKELKRLIKKYVKVYGYKEGRRKAYAEWHKRKKERARKRLGIWGRRW
jgi:hypothetical protein